MTPYGRLGVDIGGTFTDATLVDVRTGDVTIEKVLSTPVDPSVGFLHAVERIMHKAQIVPENVESVVHATTVATNSIIEGTTARTAFVTTEGFRDMLELARQMRPSLYDLRFVKPSTIVERRRCFGVTERLDARGAVLTPLDDGSVRAVAHLLRAQRTESVALCFLHSYINDEHERRAGEILAQELPDVFISLSVDVAPECREYFRASTTVINAAIAPTVGTYLARLEERLAASGLPSDLLIMQSSGGVYTSRAARESPVHMVESGPAAGVIAATHLASTLGYPSILSLDMGGTTAKTCLVKDGVPKITKEYEVGTTAGPGAGSSRGSGYPIRTPVIDLVEIGSGGGSIAWIDDGGALRVGPQSAGASPGPACYPNGGVQPTVTDANLVLGRLNAEYFLGGSVRLDVSAAESAVGRCADMLGLGITETAHAIVEIANTAMVNALRLVSLQHGYDPRDFLLVAFGGAGPVHANRLAEELGVKKTLIPMSAGIFSAMGLLVTDLRREHSAPLMKPSQGLDVSAASNLFLSLQDKGRQDLAGDGIAPDRMSFQRYIDLRYVGQSYELSIEVSDGPFNTISLANIVEQFHEDHDRAYGHRALSDPVEVVNLRVSATGRIPKPRLRKIRTVASPYAPSQRPVYFSEYGYTACSVYNRYSLTPATVIDGPAVIEEFDTSTVLHHGFQARVDEFGNLFITRDSSARDGPESALPQ